MHEDALRARFLRAQGLEVGGPQQGPQAACSAAFGSAVVGPGGAPSVWFCLVSVDRDRRYVVHGSVRAASLDAATAHLQPRTGQFVAARAALATMTRLPDTGPAVCYRCGHAFEVAGMRQRLAARGRTNGALCWSCQREVVR